MFTSNSKKALPSILLIIFCSVFMYTEPTLSNIIVSQIIQQDVSDSFNKELQCLTENVYYEAGSESYEGKLAVAQVTINRVNSGKFAPDICSVVHQKTGNTYQFSWVGLVNKNASKDKYQWEEAQIVARKALTESKLHDTIARTNALYYHADYVNPGWNNKKVVQKIGRHIFYVSI
jgi:hypothetical protein